MPSPILYAHRGAAAEQPENTLPAFQRAIEIGVDAIETDAHMTADGHIIISHDADAQRMTGTPLVFKQATLQQVKELDAGWGFVDESGDRPFAGQGYRIPTLEEALAECPGLPFNVDLKPAGMGMARAGVELVRRLGATDRVTLASSRYSALLTVRGMRYEGKTNLSSYEVGLVVFAPARVYRALPLKGNKAQVPTRSGPISLATRRFIDKCHSLNLTVDYWTINDPAEAQSLLDLGADGIMTDDPAAMMPIFEALRRAAR